MTSTDASLPHKKQELSRDLDFISFVEDQAPVLDNETIDREEVIIFFCKDCLKTSMEEDLKTKTERIPLSKKEQRNNQGR